MCWRRKRAFHTESRVSSPPAVEEFLRISRDSRVEVEVNACVAPESKLGGAGRLSNSFDVCDAFESIVLPKLALAFAILFLVPRPLLLPVLVVCQ